MRGELFAIVEVDPAVIVKVDKTLRGNFGQDARWIDAQLRLELAYEPFARPHLALYPINFNGDELGMVVREVRLFRLQRRSSIDITHSAFLSAALRAGI